MKKVPLYSRSGPAPARPVDPAGAAPDAAPSSVPAQARAGTATAASSGGARRLGVPSSAPRPAAATPHPPPGRSAVVRRRLGAAIPGLTVGLAVAALVVSHDATRQGAAAPTQKDIDAAVLHTLATKTLPSAAARAYEAVRPSVVLVRGTLHHAAADGPPAAVPAAPGPAGKGQGSRAGSGPTAPRADADEVERAVGTGVVIVDSGLILTNLHVVSGSDGLEVVFADGTVSKASLVSVQPENDLAVLQAQTLPDDLQAATLRSTKDLAPGDQVVAVGFPFGIGPSVSSGVVSGLRREHRTPQGQRVLTNLIQFDAAANPGNSGGPLVTMDGEVVGIVTAILNPTEARTFIGIGFAVPIENAARGAGLAPY